MNGSKKHQRQNDLNAALCSQKHWLRIILRVKPEGMLFGKPLHTPYRVRGRLCANAALQARIMR